MSMYAWFPSSTVLPSSHNNTERPYKCTKPGCFLRFKRKFTLKEHIKTHTGEKPYVCPVETCGKTFATSGNLTRHMRLHPWLTPLMCLVGGCDRSFSSEMRLEEHLKRHFRGPPMVQVCPIAHCQKEFRTVGNLVRHFNQQHHKISIFEAYELNKENLFDAVHAAERQSDVYKHIDAAIAFNPELSEASDMRDSTDTKDGFCQTRMYFDASRAYNPLMNEASDVTDEELLATLACLF